MYAMVFTLSLERSAWSSFFQPVIRNPKHIRTDNRNPTVRRA